MIDSSHKDFVVFRSDFNQITIANKNNLDISYSLTIHLPVFSLLIVKDSLILGLSSELLNFNLVSKTLEGK